MVAKNVRLIFAFIAGVSLAATVFVLSGAFYIFYPDWAQIGLAYLLVGLPLLLETLGAIGLIAGWFTKKLKTRLVISILQWISGIFGVAAIFDLIMRHTRKSAWMFEGRGPFVVDTILILLFVLWIAVSYALPDKQKA